MTNRRIAIVAVRNGQPGSGGIEAILEVGGEAILIGSDVAAAAAGLTGFATDVTLIEAGDFAPAAWAAALASLVDASSVIVLAASPDGRDLAPRLAARLDRPLLAGAMTVGSDIVTVLRHGGLVQVDLAAPERFVATLQPGVRGVEPDASLPAPTVRSIEFVVGPAADPVVLEVRPPDAATMDLTEAPRIVGGGAGMLGDGADERFEQLTRFGEAIGASMGATRVVTDAGVVSHQRQIGTTGVVVDPHLYLAFAISGAVQHTAGLGHPEHVISVNTDPHCPMMAMADLAVVADANATLDALAARLVTQSAEVARG